MSAACNDVSKPKLSVLLVLRQLLLMLLMHGISFVYSVDDIHQLYEWHVARYCKPLESRITLAALDAVSVVTVLTESHLLLTWWAKSTVSLTTIGNLFLPCTKHLALL